MSEVQIAIIDQEDTQITLAVPGVQGPSGAISSGGSANQVFYKVSGTNYDAGWTFIGNANVDAAAAIAGTKISPNFGSQATVTTGTNTAASFIPTSATIPSNGIYLPGANQLAVATNGTEKLIVLSNGNVGIGTSSPGGKLDVRDAGTTIPALGAVGTGLNVRRTDGAIGLIIGYENAIGGSYIQAQHTNGSATAYPLYLQPNGGNVGIGTTSVGNTLHVYSTAATDVAQIQSSQNFSTLKFVSALNTNSVTIGSDGAGNAQIENKDTSKAIVFTTGGGEAAQIDSSKRLLVGTTSHSGANLLQVNSDALINGITVGRGLASISTNTAVGSGALSDNTTGSNNTANGFQALYFNTTGSSNTAIGSAAGYAINTGAGNISIGGLTSTGATSPVFATGSENNRISMGSTAVTNAYIQVAWTVVSDARDKTNFAPVPHGLDFVNALKPTAFQFKLDRESDQANGPVRYGFKAQDILELEGENSIIIDSVNPDKLYYNGESLIPVLVNAIKELSAKNTALEARLTAAGID